MSLAFGVAIYFIIWWIVLFAMNLMGVTRVSAYLVIGVIIWVAVVKSGVHATLNGVMVALAIVVPVLAGLAARAAVAENRRAAISTTKFRSDPGSPGPGRRRR